MVTRRANDQSRRSDFATALMIVALAMSGAAHAAPQGCPNPRASGDVVVIGSLAELAGEVGLSAQRRLLAAFEMKFDRAGDALEDGAQVLYCDGRQIGERNAYDHDVVRILNDERVLLEIGARPDSQDIVMTYVVVPIRYYGFEAAQIVDEGYYYALYDRDRITEGLDRLFRDNAELRLMAALALAIRFEKLADGEPDDARRRELMHRSRAFYCDAIGTLPDAKPVDLARGLDDQVWGSLHNVATLGASRVFRKALGDGDSILRVVAFERESGLASAQAGALPDPSACVF